MKVRIDKWLWAVRIFKTRTMAANACKSGKIKLNGSLAKPAQNMQAGDIVGVKKNNFNLVFKANQLIEKRVSAALAEPCYSNLTPDDELNKFKSWYLINTAGEFRDKGAGRPTKKERREIDDFKTIEFWDDDDDETTGDTDLFLDAEEEESA